MNFKLNLISVILIATLSMDCYHENDKGYFKNRIEFVLQTKIPDDFKVVEHKSFASIGDNVEQFTLMFEKEDFQQWLKKLDITKLEKYSKDDLLSMNRIIDDNETVSIIVDIKKHCIKYTYAEL